MDSIEKLLKTERPAPQPEHSFQIIFQDSEPKLIDVKQLERDAKEYQKESLVIKQSDDNKPIFIDPKKYPSPHMIIYEPVTDYRELEKFGGKCVKLGNGGTTFDPCMEISKLPDDEKDKLTQEIIKIIEKREEERKLE
jgi:hypothetical protein